MKHTPNHYLKLPILALVALLCSAMNVRAETAAEIDRDVNGAIQKLYKESKA